MLFSICIYIVFYVFYYTYNNIVDMIVCNVVFYVSNTIFYNILHYVG